MEEDTFDPSYRIFSNAFALDAHTLNYVAELALRDREEGEFSSSMLADIYVRHVLQVLNLELSPESCKRIVEHMEINFRTVALQGAESSLVRGYICVGTTFVKKITNGSKVGFALKWHPRLNEILSY